MLQNGREKIVIIDEKASFLNVLKFSETLEESLMILGNSIAIPFAKTGRWPSRTLPRIGKTRKSTSFNRGVNCKASKKQTHVANSVVQFNQMEMKLKM